MSSVQSNLKAYLFSVCTARVLVGITHTVNKKKKDLRPQQLTYTKMFVLNEKNPFGKHSTQRLYFTYFLHNQTEGASHEEGNASERHPPASKLTGCLHLVIDT